MIKALQHTDATTVADAVNILSDYGDKAMLMAGGTDLLGMLKTGASAVYPEILNNLKTIPGLDYIKEDGEGLKIGALTRLADIIDSPVATDRAPDPEHGHPWRKPGPGYAVLVLSLSARDRQPDHVPPEGDGKMPGSQRR